MKALHVLKIKDHFYDAIIKGDKTFEVRLNDRGFQKNDEIRFTDEIGSIDRDGLFEVTYVHNGLGMRNDFCCLAIKRIDGGLESKSWIKEPQ